MRRLLSLLLALPAAALLVWAQAETGQITGTVTDPSGGAVANAAIEVVSTTTGTERAVATNRSGVYSVTNLEPGEYGVAVSAPAFPR